MNNKPTHAMQVVFDWVTEAIQVGESPPWEWYQLMKLREVLDVVMNDVTPFTKLESLPATILTVVQAKEDAPTCASNVVGFKKAGE